MEKKLLIHTLDQLFKLNRLAEKVPESVYLKQKNGSITANAKSGLNLFALDLSSPVTVVSESAELMDILEKEYVNLD